MRLHPLSRIPLSWCDLFCSPGSRVRVMRTALAERSRSTAVIYGSCAPPRLTSCYPTSRYLASPHLLLSRRFKTPHLSSPHLTSSPLPVLRCHSLYPIHHRLSLPTSASLISPEPPRPLPRSPNALKRWATAIPTSSCSPTATPRPPLTSTGTALRQKLRGLVLLQLMAQGGRWLGSNVRVLHIAPLWSETHSWCF